MSLMDCFEYHSLLLPIYHTKAIVLFTYFLTFTTYCTLFNTYMISQSRFAYRKHIFVEV